MVEVTEARITQTDIVAAEAQVGKHYQTAYDYEMDLRQSYAAHREAAAKAERDRLRNLPDDVVETAWDRLPWWVDVSNTEIKLIAKALADALESKP